MTVCYLTLYLWVYLDLGRTGTAHIFPSIIPPVDYAVLPLYLDVSGYSGLLHQDFMLASAVQ